MAVAFTALLVALSGTGYAVTQLPRNSVGAKQLQTNAVSSAKVKNGSLRAADFRAGDLPAGAQGATGPKGDTGAPGATGPKGADGAKGAGGPKGADGATGATGAQGQQGPAGADGATGPAGAQGPQGTAGTTGATGATGGQGPAGASAYVRTTTVTATTGLVSDTTVTDNWDALETLGDFTKSAASTGILIHANITGRALSAGFCRYQVRVDGATILGTSNLITNSVGSAAFDDAGSVTHPLAIDTDFGVLPAGTHTVSIWVSGNTASGCRADPDNFKQERALIEEYTPPAP